MYYLMHSLITALCFYESHCVRAVCPLYLSIYTSHCSLALPGSQCLNSKNSRHYRKINGTLSLPIQIFVANIGSCVVSWKYNNSNL